MVYVIALEMDDNLANHQAVEDRMASTPREVPADHRRGSINSRSPKKQMLIKLETSCEPSST